MLLCLFCYYNFLGEFIDSGESDGLGVDTGVVVLGLFGGYDNGNPFQGGHFG